MFFAQRDLLSMVKWSPHRPVLGTVGANGQIYVYDPAQAVRLHWPEDLHGTRQPGIFCMSWGPVLTPSRAELLAIGGQAGVVEVWDMCSIQKVSVYTGHSPEVAELPATIPPNRRAISALAWSPDGTLLASAGDDMRVHVWHPTTGETITVADCEPFRAGCLLAWLSSRTLISSSMSCVYIWDVFTGRVLREIHTELAWEKPNVYALAPSRRHLAVASGSSVLIYNLLTGKQAGRYSPTDQLRGFALYQSSPSLVVWNPDGYRLATCFASEPNRIFLWSVRGKKTLQVREHFADITCLDWSADGSQLAWGGDGYVATASFPRPASPPPIAPHLSSDHSPATAELARSRG